MEKEVNLTDPAGADEVVKNVPDPSISESPENNKPSGNPEPTIEEDSAISPVSRTPTQETHQTLKEETPMEKLRNRIETIINDGRFVIDPEGDLIFRWMTIVALAVGFNVWLIILRIAFMELEEEAVSCSIFYILDTLCDVIFLLDVVFNFRMGYLEQGLLVRDPRKLAQNYCKKMSFRLDLICLLPIERIIPTFYYVPRTTYRLHRLLKMYALEKFFAVWDSRTSNPNRHRATKLTFYLAGVIHWTGCIYYMVSKYEGFGSTEWVYSETHRNESFATKYIRVIYWSTVTLTTIGGTENPITNIEHVFMIVTFMVGVFIFATVVGNVGDVISNMNAARQEYQAKMDAIKFYMNHRQVPAHIQSRVKKWSNYAWSRTQALEDQEFLEFLPPRLRAEIAVHVHLETLQKVKIFSDCEEGFLGELVLRLRSQIYSPGDYICRRGEIGREMYIINHGKVQVVVTDAVTEERMVVATLSEGNYFGEISLLKLNEGQNRRTADVVSLGYSELLCLSKKDLMQALVEYPEAKDVLEKHGRDRVNQNKEAARLQRRISMGDSVKMLLKQKEESEVDSKKVKTKKMWRKAYDRSMETKELNGIIRSLRTFDSISTAKQLGELESKCEELTQKLAERDQQLALAVRRFAELEQLIGVNGTAKNGHTHTDARISRTDIGTATTNRNGATHTDDAFERRVRRIQDIFESHIRRIYSTDPRGSGGGGDNCCVTHSDDDVICRDTKVGDLPRRRTKHKRRKKTSRSVCNLSYSRDHSMTKMRFTGIRSMDSALTSLLIPGIKINDVILQPPISFEPDISEAGGSYITSEGHKGIERLLDVSTKGKPRRMRTSSGQSHSSGFSDIMEISVKPNVDGKQVTAHKEERRGFKLKVSTNERLVRTSTMESHSSELSDIMNNNEEEDGRSQSSQCVEVHEMSLVSISPVTSAELSDDSVSSGSSSGSELL